MFFKIFLMLNIPILKYKQKLIYFDSSSTNQKPKIFFKSIINCLKKKNFNLQRNDFYKSLKLNIFYNKIKLLIKKIINCKSTEEIIFFYNSTSSINFIINNFYNFFYKNDEIIISNLEHNSILLPFLKFIKNKKIFLKIFPTFKNIIFINLFCNYFSNLTKLIVINFTSNNFGIINKIKNISKIIHFNNCLILVDCTQSINCLNLNILKINIDFLFFSFHKLYSSTGVSVIYIKKIFINKFSIFYLGGGIINYISYKKIIFKKMSKKFNVGTLNLIGIFSSYYSLKWFLKNKKILFFIHNYLKKCIFFLFKKKKKYITNIFLIKINKNYLINFFFEINKIILRCNKMCNYIKNMFLNKFYNCRMSISFYNKIKEFFKIKFLIYYFNYKIR